jgi:putative ABC transport system permease protein
MPLHVLTRALRRLRQRPGFSAAVIVVLALAVGANTAIFTLVQTILLRPLPLREPEGLVTLAIVKPGSDRHPLSLPDLVDVRAQSRTLDGVAGLFGWSVNLTELDEAERLQGLRVTPNYFVVTGASVELGRAIQPADEQERVVLISHGFWSRRFGRAPDVVGRMLTLNGEAFAIAGVLRQDHISLFRDVDVIAPFSPSTDPRRGSRVQAFLRVIARTRQGVTPGQVTDDLNALSRRMQAAYPEAHGSDIGFVVKPLHEEITGRAAPILRMLMAAVAVTLLVACGNIANLFLLQGGLRRRELAVRTALGATRARLARELAIESSVLGILGGVLGVAVARALVAILIAIGPADLPRVAEIALSWSAALFTLSVALATSLVFGLVPALHGSRSDQRDALSAGGRTIGGSNARLRTSLVFAEVTLCTLLLITAALLARSFHGVMRVDPGFESSQVLTIRMSLPRSRYSDRAAIENFYRQVHPRLAALPGIRTAAAANVVPMNGYLATTAFSIDGRAMEADAPEAHYRMISPDYFRALRIEIHQGRPFTDADRSDSQPVAIVNETFARQYWSDRNPLGARVRLADGEKTPRVVEVVGVIADVRHFGLERESTLEVYVPISQVPDTTTQWLANNMYWVLETSGAPLAASNAVRREIAAVDPNVPASFVRSMDQWVGLSIAPRRFNLQLVLAFTLAALGLSIIGVYALAASVVTARTREIGIRTALGASTTAVTALVLRGGLTPVVLGLVAGTGTAAVLAPMAASLLFGVAPRDPASLMVAASVVASAALFATYFPARRAAKIDPIVTLRAE